MADAQTIEFNYQKALAQADSLDEISKNVSNISKDKFQDSIHTIDKNWDGDNSKKFIGKCKTLKDKMDTSAGDISEIADAIRKIAKAIYDAEMANINIAKTRSAK